MVERKVAFLVLLVGAQALWWLGAWVWVGGLLLFLLLIPIGLCALADPRCLKKVWSGRKSCLSSLKLAL
jgi:hypothetical protein